MATNCPDDNKAYCKAYYQRLKQDPAKWKAFLEKRARYRQKSFVPMQLRVYLIEAEGLGYIKIGLAENPSFRLKQLQTGSPVKLRLRASIPCDVKDAQAYERGLHKQLKEYHVLGEWFLADAPLIQGMLQGVSEEPRRDPDPSKLIAEFLALLGQ